MSDELKDISSDNNDREQEKLLQYLQGKMPDEAQHDFEKMISEDEFLYDAVEGLEEVKNKQNLQLMIRQLNVDLKKQVEKKKERKNKREIRQQSQVNFALVLILLLAIIAYLVIKRFE